MNADLSIVNHVSQLNVLQQLDHLRTYPVVRSRTDTGELRLHAWWFDIANAEVLTYVEKARRFVAIDEAEAERLLRRVEGG